MTDKELIAYLFGYIFRIREVINDDQQIILSPRQLDALLIKIDNHIRRIPENPE